MLQKKECTEAVNNWKTMKSDYSNISDLINPQSVFSFDKEQIAWIDNNNDNTNFHIYIGVYQNELIIIVVPLDKDGNEIDLPSYETSPLKPLAQDIHLIEKEETTKIKRTILSANLQITSYTEEYQLPTEKKPSVRQKTAIEEIESWSNQCLDWFYRECYEFEGLRVFNTFTIPFADLGKQNGETATIICLFAFKDSYLYQRPIPTLIFISVNSNLNAQVIESPIDGNAYNWSQPCPPFCKAEKKFIVFETGQ